ncbi:hypothetical protein LX36DRAFT_433430 [Colletotrichum falcatum]|nr:hypothetical protein LX36DRAFT_433430 [Colletotrichum falcatum]
MHAQMGRARPETRYRHAKPNMSALQLIKACAMQRSAASIHLLWQRQRQRQRRLVVHQKSRHNRLSRVLALPVVPAVCGWRVLSALPPALPLGFRMHMQNHSSRAYFFGWLIVCLFRFFFLAHLPRAPRLTRPPRSSKRKQRSVCCVLGHSTLAAASQRPHIPPTPTTYLILILREMGKSSSSDANGARAPASSLQGTTIWRDGDL